MRTYDISHFAAVDLACRDLLEAARGARLAVERDVLEEVDPFREVDAVGRALSAARNLLEVEINGLDPNTPDAYRREMIKVREVIGDFLHFGGQATASAQAPIAANDLSDRQ